LLVYYILYNNRYLVHEDKCTFLIVSRSILLRMRSVADECCTENQNIHFVFSNRFFFFRKSYHLSDNVEKYCTAGQATGGSMVLVHCVLDTQGYKHTLTIRNTYYFSTATVVARARRNGSLYVQCVCCCGYTVNETSKGKELSV